MTPNAPTEAVLSNADTLMSVQGISKAFGDQRVLGLLAPLPLLLMDEPFDGFDLRQTREVMSSLREEALHGRTLLISIHQLGDAQRVCDRLVLLSAGRVVATGTSAALTASAGLPVGSDLEEVFLALA